MCLGICLGVYACGINYAEKVLEFADSQVVVLTCKQKKSTHPCMLRESAISEKVIIDKLI